MPDVSCQASEQGSLSGSDPSPRGTDPSLRQQLTEKFIQKWARDQRWPSLPGDREEAWAAFRNILATQCHI